MRSNMFQFAAGGLCAAGLLLSSQAYAQTVTVTASPNPAIAGQPVTLTATMSEVCAGGNVTFNDAAPDAPIIPIVPLNTTGLTTTTTVSDLPLGANPISVNVFVPALPPCAANTNSTEPFNETINPAIVVPTLVSWAKFGFMGLLVASGAVLLFRRGRKAA